MVSQFCNTRPSTVFSARKRGHLVFHSRFGEDSSRAFDLFRSTSRDLRVEQHSFQLRFQEVGSISWDNSSEPTVEDPISNQIREDDFEQLHRFLNLAGSLKQYVAATRPNVWSWTAGLKEAILNSKPLDRFFLPCSIGQPRVALQCCYDSARFREIS